MDVVTGELVVFPSGAGVPGDSLSVLLLPELSLLWRINPLVSSPARVIVTTVIHADLRVSRFFMVVWTIF
jgi:hypothetical protein